MTPEIQQQIAAVGALRLGLNRNGFRPVPCLSGDKVPLGNKWQERARQDPPECLRWDPVVHALNTGILCDGLRLFDFDINDARLAAVATDLVVQRLGDAPRRFRRDSPRCCLLYRAAGGQPQKRSIVGSKGKIEVLGRGQQVLAFGRHPSGADLEWTVSPASQVTLIDLPVASEEQITALLEELAPLIGAPPPEVSTSGDGAERAASEPQADIGRVAEAMGRITNSGQADWEWWNRIGLALWAATGGSKEGRKLWHEWSALNPCNDAKATEARWRHYRRSPPDQLGAGTLFHLSQQTLQAALGDFLDLGLDSEATDEDASQASSSEAADPWAQAAQSQPQQPEYELPALPPEPDWPEQISREAYRGLLGEIVDATIPTTEADPNAILLQHLAFFGSAIGIGDTTPWCVGGKVIHRTNLFELIVGKSAYSRKGTATAEVSFIYDLVDQRWQRHHRKSGLSSGEGLIMAVCDEEAHIDPKSGDVIIDRPASKTKNILVVEHEFGRPLTAMQRQGNTLNDLIKLAWDGGILESMTKSPVRATGHLISIIAQDTFASLTENLPLVSTQDGFANRFLLACVRRAQKLPSPPEFEATALAGFVAGLQAALRAARLVGRMTKTPQGETIWRDLYDRLSQPRPGLYGAVISRGDVQVLRMAMIFALLEQRREIDVAHFEAALAVWRFCTASARYLFGERQSSPVAEKVLDELRHASNGLTRTELHAAFGRNITKGTLLGALTALARDGAARREVRTTGGRPAEVWFHHGRGQKP